MTTRRVVVAATAVSVAAGVGLLAGGMSQAVADTCDTTTAQQVIADSPVPLPDGWTVEVTCGGQGLIAGQAHPGSRTVTIWADRHDTADQVEWTWLHEVGHAYDLDGRYDRGAWAWLRGLDEHSYWWIADRWWDAGAEDLAEAFAACLMPHGDHRAGVGWQPPTEVQCQLVTEPISGDRR